MKFWQKILWAAVAVIGAWCFGVLALNKGESISAVWLVVASACIYLIGYTFYGRFIAYRVFESLRTNTFFSATISPLSQAPDRS